MKTATMSKNRLEAFTDGVMAVIVTIMLLEIKVPHASHFVDLLPLVPKFLSYVLSFLYVVIYWNNHHHMFQIVKNVSGGVLWANAHLLFWLSLLPFVTAWSGENQFAPDPVAAYGFVLMMSGIAYYILTRALVGCEGHNSDLATALGKDFKGKVSLVIYTLSIPLAYLNSYVSLSLFAIVASIWFIPDRRVEKVITK